MEVRIFISGKPVPAARPRVPRFGKAYFPKSYQAYRELLHGEFAAFAGALTDRRYRAELHFYGARKDSDLDNLAKGVLDAAVVAGVVTDDSVQWLDELTVRWSPAPSPDRGVRVRLWASDVVDGNE